MTVGVSRPLRLGLARGVFDRLALPALCHKQLDEFGRRLLHGRVTPKVSEGGLQEELR